MLASDGDSLVGLWLDGQKYYAATLTGEIEEKKELPVFVKTAEWLDAYFAKEKPEISMLPLAPQGSKFRKAVWEVLCEIPYGEVISYGEAALKACGKLGTASTSARAAGGAVGHNPISIIIPCHRVVGADGRLTGYAGGVDKKVTLLTLEGVPLCGEGKSLRAAKRLKG